VVPLERPLSRSTKVALAVILPALVVLFTGLVGRVHGVREFAVFSAMSKSETRCTTSCEAFPRRPR
jgi:hypothetical protein